MIILSMVSFMLTDVELWLSWRNNSLTMSQVLQDVTRDLMKIIAEGKFMFEV